MNLNICPSVCHTAIGVQPFVDDTSFTWQIKSRLQRGAPVHGDSSLGTKRRLFISEMILFAKVKLRVRFSDHDRGGILARNRNHRFLISITPHCH